MQIWILASNVYGFSVNNLSIDSGSSSQSISMKRARSMKNVQIASLDPLMILVQQTLVCSSTTCL